MNKLIILALISLMISCNNDADIKIFNDDVKKSKLIGKAGDARIYLFEYEDKKYIIVKYIEGGISIIEHKNTK